MSVAFVRGPSNSVWEQHTESVSSARDVHNRLNDVRLDSRLRFAGRVLLESLQEQ
jgi:hypothetical protein